MESQYRRQVAANHLAQVLFELFPLTYNIMVKTHTNTKKREGVVVLNLNMERKCDYQQFIGLQFPVQQAFCGTKGFVMGLAILVSIRIRICLMCVLYSAKHQASHCIVNKLISSRYPAVQKTTIVSVKITCILKAYLLEMSHHLHVFVLVTIINSKNTVPPVLPLKNIQKQFYLSKVPCVCSGLVFLFRL